MRYEKGLHGFQLFITAIFMIALFAPDLKGVELLYSRTINLPPIKMSYSNLQELLDKVSKVILTANSKHNPDKYLEETVIFYADKVKIDISGHSFLSSKAKLPKMLNRMICIYKIE